MKSDKTKGSAYVGVIIAAIAYAWAAILIRWAQEASPLIIAFYRMVIASVAWTPMFFFWKSKEPARPFSPRQFRYMLIAGGFLCFHFATWTASLSYTTVASAVFLILLQPLLIAIAAHIILKERLNRWNVAAIFITLGGSFLIYHGDLQLGRQYFFGDILALIGAIGSTGYLFMARIARPDRQGAEPGIPLNRYLPVVYWTATIGLGFICLITGQSYAPYSFNTWMGLIALGLIPTVIGHSLFNWALRYLPAFSVNIALVGEPLGASLLAYFLLQEVPSKGLLLGAPLMILAVFLVFSFPPESGLPGSHPRCHSHESRNH